MDNLTDEEFKNIMKEMRKRVECPVCLNTLKPPVSQCENGHAVCCLCKPRLNSCPSCKGFFTGFRNRAFDFVLSLLPHKCKHEGCEEVVKSDDDHEAWCGHQPITCKLCEWKGPANDVLTHVKTRHKYSCFKVKKSNVMNIKVGEYQSFPTPLIAYDQLFWEETIFNKEEGSLKINYSLVPCNKIRHSFVIKVELRKEQFYHVARTTVTTETVLIEGNSLVLNNFILKNFSNEDNVRYNFSIKKVGLDS